MITIDSHPTINPVYLGAYILKFTHDNSQFVFDVEFLYVKLKEKFGIAYDVFVYTLDWLYLIEAVDIDEQGRLKF